MWEGVSTIGSSNLKYEMDFVLMDDGRWILKWFNSADDG